ncbi:MAG: hypothetical protein JNJ88_01870 [Planctomycetes bacterium]|nr:hypothetical protein [Planctomycetota bacterium]
MFQNALRLLVFLVMASALAVGNAFSQLSTPIPLGVGAHGVVTNAGEADHWLFAALKGDVVKIRVTAKDGMIPKVTLRDATTHDPIDLGPYMLGAGTFKVDIVGFAPTTPSVFDLEITSLNGVPGSYKLQTGTKPAPSIAKITVPAVGGDSSIPIHTFFALAGSKATIQIQAAKGSEAVPELTSIVGPEGVLHVDAYFKSKNGKITVNKLPLKKFGAYSVFARSSAEIGALNVQVKVIRPKVNKKIYPEGVSASLADLFTTVAKNAGQSDGSIQDLIMALDEVFAISQDPDAGFKTSQASALWALKNESIIEDSLQAMKSAGEIYTLPIAGSPTLALFASGGAGLCPQDHRTIVYYVNGVLTSPSNATISATHLNYHIRQALPPDQLDKVEVKLFLNKSGLNGRLAEGCYSAIQQFSPACILADLLGGIWNSASDAFEFACEKIQKICGFTGALDFGEALIQWFDQILVIPIDVGDAGKLAAAVTQDLLSGHKVVLVGHSQGNFYVQQALSQIPVSLRPSVGVIAVASPAVNFPALQAGYFKAVTLVKDVILTVPGSWPANTTNELSNEPCGLVVNSCALQAIAVHAFDTSYLYYSSSRIPIISGVIAAHLGLPVPSGTLGQGFLQATLTWNIPGDIDLHVTEATGAHVFYGDKVGDVGELDKDDIPGTGPENYFVCDEAEMVPGNYKVSVNNYNGTAGTTTTVVIKAGSKIKSYTVIVGPPNQNQVLIPVATVHYSVTGEFTISP